MMLSKRCGLVLAVLLHGSVVALPAIDARYNEDHGQTEEGFPFYVDNPLFDELVVSFKEIEPMSEIGREIIQTMHEAFIGCSGDTDEILDGWLQVCVAVDHLSAIVGCLDAPSLHTGRRAIHQAAVNGDGLKINWLAQQGVDVDAYTAPNAQGFQSAFTPAHLAVMHRQIDALEALESAGANMMSRNVENGFTPLDVAKEMGFEDVALWFSERAQSNKNDL